jgi:phosphoribosylformylglycinamidine cyclo-ligase
MSITYKDAGVDIDAGDELVQRIKPLARATMRPEVVGSLGGFAGLCGLPTRYKDPLLVSGTDGVGTKLKSAFATGRHDTIGIDLVAMNVNDVAVTGAEPLFFLDYFASSKLDVGVAEQVIKGIAEGCRQARCALIGGETAELPGLYAPGEYDLAGFCVGVVERDGVRDGRDLREGDVLVGLGSSGLHSNGHSLARKVVLEKLALAWDERPDLLEGASVADELLRPTKIYVAALAAVGEAGVGWRGAAHITGGGLVENPPRFVPEGSGLALRIELGTWPVPGIFRLIEGAGVASAEMRRTFNMGIGMVIAVAPEQADEAMKAAQRAGEKAYRIGQVIPRAKDEVEFA